ncbi:MAG: Fur family transcriptional regulator [Candidatus Ratteibacteria bacterium]
MKREEILKIFKEKNIKPSVQRIGIFEYLSKFKSHPSVDEIYSILNSKIPTLSKATIYNTLKLFCEKGLIGEVLIQEDEVRYDFIEKPHFHFKCKICKKIYDIYKECQIIEMKEINGHKIEQHHIYLIGICSSCLKND